MYPQQNPYFATPAQQNGFYQQPQVQVLPGLRGKPIADSSEIGIQDVPADGSVAFFPSKDGEYIMTKSWRADGTIETRRFSLDKVTFPQKEDHSYDDLLKRVEKLETELGVNV